MATQITATLPTLDFPQEVDYPTQEDWAAFSAAAELNFGILGGSWSTQMQNWKDQANAMSIELNNNADIAQSIANYQGDWTSKGYTLGQSVSVSRVYYICKLTHATGQNPTTGSSLYWNLALGNWNLKVDKVASTDNAIPRFDGTTGALQNSSAIITDTGDIGINNNTPLSKLHVGGSIIASDPIYINNNSFIGAILNNSNVNPCLDIRRWNGTGTNHGVVKIAGNSSGDILFYSDVKSTNIEATTEKMKLTANCNLLIGTSVSNGLDKVQIEGAFSSKAVKGFGGIDLNTLKTRTEVCSVSSTCTNLPIAETGFLEVFIFDPTSLWVMQRFTAMGYPNASNQGRTYVRNWMNGSTWSAWVEK